MGLVDLIIEVGNKLVVGGDQLDPARRALEVPVGHPAHHIEVGLDIYRRALRWSVLSLATPRQGYLVSLAYVNGLNQGLRW